MGLEVALDKMRGAGIGQQNLEDFRFDLIVLKGFDGRNAESLFRNMRPPRLAARRPAAKVHPVTPADRKAQQFRALVKNRLNPGDVINMGAAPVGVVHHIDVALLHVFDAELVAHGMGRKLHGRQVDGDVGGLAQQPHLRIINGIGEINHIGQNGRERRPLEHHRHPITGVFKQIPQDLEGNMIESAPVFNAVACLFEYA